MGLMTRFVDGSASCWEKGKSWPRTQEKLWKSLWPGDVSRGHLVAAAVESVDELVEGLNENGYNTLGYADDIAILVSGKFPSTVSELLQEVLSIVQQWRERIQLSINPQKMVIVPFTRKRDLRGSKEQPSLDINCNWLQKSNTSDSLWTRD
jgi:hypothetical protein